MGTKYSFADSRCAKVALALAATLTACGQGKKNDSSAAPPATTHQPPATTAACTTACPPTGTPADHGPVTPPTTAPGSPAPTPPPTTTTPTPAHYANPLDYVPAETAAVAKVFADFGALYVAEQPLTTVKVDQVPWAGYWYPFSGSELFDGDNSPLAKLDQVLQKLGKQPGAAAWEKQLHDQNNYDTWEGRCFAWAMAAITTKEPQGPVTYQGVTFSVSDQKALLTMISEGKAYTQYGIRFDGTEATDGTFQDLRPEAFHQAALTILGQQHRAFFIDEDPGVQVWSTPIDQIDYSIVKDTSKPNAYLLTETVHQTKYRESIVDDLTTIDDLTTYIYKARLYVDPTAVQNGKYKVVGGEWLEDSIDWHPDTLDLPVAGGKAASNNPVVTANLDTVQQIVGP